MRQGRLDDAHELLSEISDRPQSRSVAAALHHAAGEHAVAAALLRRSIGAAGSQILDIVGALDLLVDTSLATNDLDSAGAAISRLEHLARTHGAQRVAAHAAFAAGRYAFASGDLATACDALERATDLFAAASAPHEAARARLALAGVLARQRSPLATTEARTAKATFERLGASRGLASADELLQTLG